MIGLLAGRMPAALRVVLLGTTTTVATACGRTEQDGAWAGQASQAAAAVPALNVDSVPLELRTLVPFVQRWGIGDDVIRNAAVDSASADEKEAFCTAMRGHNARITAWLDSFGQNAMTAEAAAFMYAQLALAEMGYTWR